MRARQIKKVDGVTLFLCGNKTCGRWLTKDGFYQNKTQKNNITSYCKQCLQKYSNKKRIKNKGEIKTDIERGKRCCMCTIQFIEEHGYQVVCKSCQRRPDFKFLKDIKLTKHNEIDLKY